MIKPMPTLAVLGVTTNFILKDKGFAEIQTVLNHLYPGIMSFGMIEVRQFAAKEIIRQHPELEHLKPIDEDWKTFAEIALEKLGPTIDIEGPHGSGTILATIGL